MAQVEGTHLPRPCWGSCGGGACSKVRWEAGARPFQSLQVSGLGSLCQPQGLMQDVNCWARIMAVENEGPSFQLRVPGSLVVCQARGGRGEEWACIPERGNNKCYYQNQEKETVFHRDRTGLGWTVPSTVILWTIVNS